MAVRPSSRFCSSGCRQWAHRNPGGALRLAPTDPNGSLARPPTGAYAPVARPVAVVSPAVYAELLAAGQTQTVLGAVALGIAAQIDGAGGLGVAPLARELRATMDAALGTIDNVNSYDPLDELRARRSYTLRRKGTRP